MKKLILVSMLALTLVGCGTYGEPLILARLYDSQDPCQAKNSPGSLPSWCGRGQPRAWVYPARKLP
jgi:hypothetical protein